MTEKCKDIVQTIMKNIIRKLIRTSTKNIPKSIKKGTPKPHFWRSFGVLLEVFLGTRGGLGPCLQKGILIYLPRATKGSILEPKRDTKIALFLFFAQSDLSNFDVFFRPAFYRFFAFLGPPGPSKTNVLLK